VTYYLLWASQGEYSDRIEWPVALYETREAAEATVKYGEALYRQLYGRGYLSWEEREKRSKSPLGQELVELVGPELSHYDELSLSCCELEMRTAPAQAIEAFGQDAKRLDAEHESAVPEGNAP
jgi:hypothetical protein